MSSTIVSGAVEQSSSANFKSDNASQQLTIGSCYVGVIGNVDLVKRKAVILVNDIRVDDCTYISGALGAYMGFTQVVQPAVGTKVLLVYNKGGSFYLPITGSTVDSPKVKGYTATGRDEAPTKKDELVSLFSSGSVPGGPNGPDDLYPGEFSWDNNMGVCLRLLFNLTQLSAGDLAKVETSLLNDMVRIVDNYFVHHNAGGDVLIWNNGRPNHEEHFTSYSHEAEGKLTENDELYPTNEFGVDLSGIEAGDTGRWRKSTYYGHLADMIHTFVTDPTSVLSTYGQEAHRAGKYRHWVGSDGMVMVQSVAGIHLELNPRIVVPTIKKKWDDPSINFEELYKNLDNSFLKLWGEGPDWTDMKTACWQMRNYARYITEFHSLARFHQLAMKGLYEIKPQKECPAPSPTCQEQDKISKNPSGEAPYGNYASISIDASGSISAIANGDTSLIMNQGNIQLNAPGNIEINAGGTLTLSGKDTSIKAARHLELVAIAGSLWLKSRTAFNALCEKGRLWFKADANIKTPSADLAAVREKYPLSDTPVDPDINNYAIVFDAPKHSILLNSGNDIIANTTEEDGRINLQSTGNKANVNVFANDTFNVLTNNSIFFKTMRIGMSSMYTGIKAFVVKLTDGFKVTQAGIDVRGIVRATSMYSISGYVGNNEKVMQYQDTKGVEPDVSSEGCEQAMTEANGLNTNDLTINIQQKELSYRWAFNKWSIPNDIKDKGSLKASILLDKCAIDETFAKDYDIVKQTDLGLLQGMTRVDSTTSQYPGNDCKQFSFVDKTVPALDALAETKFNESMIKKFSDMKASVYTIAFNK